MSFLIFYKFVAERKGFEPSIRFWRIHAFQACAFDRSATSLLCCHFLKWSAKYHKKNNAIKKLVG